MENLTWIDKCSYKIYKTQINKFSKNNGLALTYEFNETIIKADLYNNIDNINFNKSSFELNTSCENINGPAIPYYNNNQNYYFVNLGEFPPINKYLLLYFHSIMNK